MDDLYDMATKATDIANAAEERLRRIAGVRRELALLITEYQGSKKDADQLENVRDFFRTWVGDREEKLKELARENREKAARCLVNGEIRSWKE